MSPLINLANTFKNLGNQIKDGTTNLGNTIQNGVTKDLGNGTRQLANGIVLGANNMVIHQIEPELVKAFNPSTISNITNTIKNPTPVIEAVARKPAFTTAIQNIPAFLKKPSLPIPSSIKPIISASQSAIKPIVASIPSVVSTLPSTVVNTYNQNESTIHTVVALTADTVAINPIGRAALMTVNVASGGRSDAYLNDGTKANSTIDLIPGGRLAQLVANKATNGKSGNIMTTVVPDPKKDIITAVKPSLIDTKTLVKQETIAKIPTSTLVSAVHNNVVMMRPKPSLIPVATQQIPEIAMAIPSTLSSGVIHDNIVATVSSGVANKPSLLHSIISPVETTLNATASSPPLLKVLQPISTLSPISLPEPIAVIKQIPKPSLIATVAVEQIAKPISTLAAFVEPVINPIIKPVEAVIKPIEQVVIKPVEKMIAAPIISTISALSSPVVPVPVPVPTLVETILPSIPDPIVSSVPLPIVSTLGQSTLSSMSNTISPPKHIDDNSNYIIPAIGIFGLMAMFLI